MCMRPWARERGPLAPHWHRTGCVRTARAGASRALQAHLELGLVHDHVRPVHVHVHDVVLAALALLVGRAGQRSVGQAQDAENPRPACARPPPPRTFLLMGLLRTTTLMRSGSSGYSGGSCGAGAGAAWPMGDSCMGAHWAQRVGAGAHEAARLQWLATAAAWAGTAAGAGGQAGKPGGRRARTHVRQEVAVVFIHVQQIRRVCLGCAALAVKVAHELHQLGPLLQERGGGAVRPCRRHARCQESTHAPVHDGLHAVACQQQQGAQGTGWALDGRAAHHPA